MFMVEFALPQAGTPSFSFFLGLSLSPNRTREDFLSVFRLFMSCGSFFFFYLLWAHRFLDSSDYEVAFLMMDFAAKLARRRATPVYASLDFFPGIVKDGDPSFPGVVAWPVLSFQEREDRLFFDLYLLITLMFFFFEIYASQFPLKRQQMLPGSFFPSRPHSLLVHPLSSRAIAREQSTPLWEMRVR